MNLMSESPRQTPIVLSDNLVKIFLQDYLVEQERLLWEYLLNQG